MKIHVENLGILKQAEFELGDLTFICGGNNTGKTYATYALFGFLYQWRHFLKVQIADQKIDELLNNGVTRIDITPYIEKAPQTLKQGCQEYTQQLQRIFASKPVHFNRSKFQVDLEREKLKAALYSGFEGKVGSAKGELFSLIKAENDKTLVVSLLLDKDKTILPPELIKDMISDNMNEMLFGQLFPSPFIASAERTGGAIFRRELNFARNRLLEEMSRAEKEIDPMKLLFKSYQDYALPVKVNVDFTRQLESIAKKDSFLAKSHPHILNDFSDIIGGDYIAGGNDTIYFKPSRKQLKLTMDESSSAVRSLLDIGFYLRHVATKRDLLMVDEPELNLHPENQRRIARLFARLVNLGIKVFITTHSDYIVKELNTLIMLKQDRPSLRRIAEKEGYHTDELVSPEQVRVYIAEKSSIKRKNKTRRSQYQTLVKANINHELGIEARSFDETINKMNEIQEAIVWGTDE